MAINEERDVGARGGEKRADELRVRDRRVALLGARCSRAEDGLERVLHVRGDARGAERCREGALGG